MTFFSATTYYKKQLIWYELTLILLLSSQNETKLVPVIIVSSIREANALINGGKCRGIILNFDINADDFFSLVSHSTGAKISISDRNDHFLIKLEK